MMNKVPLMILLASCAVSVNAQSSHSGQCSGVYGVDAFVDIQEGCHEYNGNISFGGSEFNILMKNASVCSSLTAILTVAIDSGSGSNRLLQAQPLVESATPRCYFGSDLGQAVGHASTSSNEYYQVSVNFNSAYQFIDNQGFTENEIYLFGSVHGGYTNHAGTVTSLTTICTPMNSNSICNGACTDTATSTCTFDDFCGEHHEEYFVKCLCWKKYYWEGCKTWRQFHGLPATPLNFP